MIFDALRLIQAAVQNYMSSLELNEAVMLDNIAMAGDLGGPKNQLNGHLVMSLVNLQEESTLKNGQYSRPVGERVAYQPPPVPVNLFLLFSALHEDYGTALKVLSRVVECFQASREISSMTVPRPLEVSPDVKVFLDLYSLTFEQLNHLWGALGGKQVPFLLYRARLVTIDAERLQAEGNAIYIPEVQIK